MPSLLSRRSHLISPHLTAPHLHHHTPISPHLTSISSHLSPQLMASDDAPPSPPPQVLMLGSFGALATLLFGAPASPFAQPRMVLLGHLQSALIAVLVSHPSSLPQSLARVALALQRTSRSDSLRV
eukprot:1137763-Rhodomonas_salina.2